MVRERNWSRLAGREVPSWYSNPRCEVWADQNDQILIIVAHSPSEFARGVATYHRCSVGGWRKKSIRDNKHYLEITSNCQFLGVIEPGQEE